MVVNEFHTVGDRRAEALSRQQLWSRVVAHRSFCRTLREGPTQQGVHLPSGPVRTQRSRARCSVEPLPCPRSPSSPRCAFAQEPTQGGDHAYCGRGRVARPTLRPPVAALDHRRDHIQEPDVQRRLRVHKLQTWVPASQARRSGQNNQGRYSSRL